MDENLMKKYWLPLSVLILLILAIYLIFLDWQSSKKEFTFAMLDVGQGDALYARSPSGVEILIDGGPPKKILNELSKVMAPFDKNIDAIFITNPDQDHIGGFLDVLKNYKVGKVFISGTTSDSKTYQNLKAIIKQEKIPEIVVRKGMKISLGENTEFDILFPDRDVSSWPTNDGSIVGKLIYKNFSVMLTGDAPIKTEDIVLREKNNLKSDVLKVAHHGSRNSTSNKFIEAVSPKYAFISDGANNRYGHPHQEILDLLNKFGVKVMRTDLLGTIIVKCDTMNVCKINK